MTFSPSLAGKVAVLSFVASCISVLFLVTFTSPVRVLLLSSIFLLLLVALWKFIPLSRVVLLSSMLGLGFGGGISLCFVSSNIRFLGAYLMVLTFFHISEYVTTAIHNPGTLSLSSFLLDHSREYGIAALASWTEYAIEYYFFPSLKSFWLISVVGIFVCVGGEALRKLAMFTASSNFTHNVQFFKRDHHQLVTSGIYGYFRHPSYVGWFYWSMGTQLILCNPLCLVAYIIASWNFFRDRIETEEELLIYFFGKDYLDYRRRVGTGLPFIEGYSGKLPPYLQEESLNVK